MKFKLLFLLCFFLSACYGLPARVDPKSFLTTSYLLTSGNMRATAFSYAGAIFTAGHVCKGMSEPTMNLATGEMDPPSGLATLSLFDPMTQSVVTLPTQLHVLSYADWPDICILEANSPIYLTSLQPARRPVEVGDEVFSVGAPLGLFPTLESGYAAAQDADMRNLPAATVPITFGYSGAPLLNEYGELVGIMSMVSRRYEHQAWYFPLSALDAFLEAVRNAQETVGPGETNSSSEAPESAE